MKYSVEIGGFVTVLRKRKLTVYANDEVEAEEKAIDKFIEIQQAAGGDLDSGDCTIDSLTEL